MQLKYLGPSSRRIIGYADFGEAGIKSDSILVDIGDVVEVSEEAGDYLLMAEFNSWQHVTDDPMIVTDDKEIVTDDAEEVE